MSEKIVFFDIDGTIYHPKIGVTNKTKEAIKLLRENGNLAFMATGRPLSMLNKEFFDLGFDGINAACGTYIVYHDKVMLNEELPQHIINETIELFKKYSIDAVFEGEQALFLDKNKVENPFLFLKDKFKVVDWNLEKILANKLSCKVKDENILNEIVPILSKYYKLIPHIESKFSELVPKLYSKATGIKYLIEYLNIPWENTYAFGDSENDEEMLKYVNNSVAMGNAVDSIKEISKYITDTIYDDGVYNGLKKLELF